MIEKEKERVQLMQEGFDLAEQQVPRVTVCLASEEFDGERTGQSPRSMFD